MKIVPTEIGTIFVKPRYHAGFEMIFLPYSLTVCSNLTLPAERKNSLVAGITQYPTSVSLVTGLSKIKGFMVGMNCTLEIAQLQPGNLNF